MALGRRLTAPLAVCCVLLLGGCRVDASVDITLRDAGSGTVTAQVVLDEAAVVRAEGTGPPLEDAVVLEDLAAAGWRVDPWVRADDGSATLTLRHDFAGEAELARRLEELGGSGTSDVALTRERGLLRSRDELRVEVDLRDAGSTVGGDADLRASLAAAGLDVDALAEDLDGELREALTVAVAVTGPGGASDSAELRIGDRSTVAVRRSAFDTGRALALAGAAAGAVLALALVAVASASARRARR